MNFSSLQANDDAHGSMAIMSTSSAITPCDMAGNGGEDLPIPEFFKFATQ